MSPNPSCSCPACIFSLPDKHQNGILIQFWTINCASAKIFFRLHNYKLNFQINAFFSPVFPENLHRKKHFFQPQISIQKKNKWNLPRRKRKRIKLEILLKKKEKLNGQAGKWGNSMVEWMDPAMIHINFALLIWNLVEKKLKTGEAWTGKFANIISVENKSAHHQLIRLGTNKTHTHQHVGRPIVMRI